MRRGFRVFVVRASRVAAVERLGLGGRDFSTDSLYPISRIKYKECHWWVVYAVRLDVIEQDLTDRLDTELGQWGTRCVDRALPGRWRQDRVNEAWGGQQRPLWAMTERCDMDRRQFIQLVGAEMAAMAIGRCWGEEMAADWGGRRPNVLFVAIDDLNDWVGCMGGHPQAKTPNIDRLARRGTLFTNAHCPAPICGPCRASVMSGLRPSTTGIYGQIKDKDIRRDNAATDAVYLSEYFQTAWVQDDGGGQAVSWRRCGCIRGVRRCV